MLRKYGELAGSYEFEQARASHSGSTIVRRVPVGVVGAIVAWNYPQLLAMMKIDPGAGGRRHRGAQAVPVDDPRRHGGGEAARKAGLPPDVLNIVAAGPEASAALVSHPDVDKIAFTGSSATGPLIGAECGRLIRRSPSNWAASRPRSFSTMPTSNPEVTIGPMATQAHLQRVLGYVAAARAGDVRLVVGGGRPKHLTRGWFVEPTIFVDVDNRDQLAREEVFGPVMAVIPYDGDDEAIRIANDSEYRLGGSVSTTDEQRGVDIARRIRTGTVGVNYYLLDVGAPFGGIKSSGWAANWGPRRSSRTWSTSRSTPAPTSSRRRHRPLVHPAAPERRPGERLE